MWGPNLAATVFHEGIPGHHFQVALAIEDDRLHDLHRQLFLPAFGEGWGLYAERLADEMGLYPNDLERLGMLTADSMRACRLVVDTGMHALGWSRQQASTSWPNTRRCNRWRSNARSIATSATPGQATSYMMGRRRSTGCARVRRRRSARFDVRDFHDVVLSRGMVSLPALGAMVGAWDGGPATTS